MEHFRLCISKSFLLPNLTHLHNDHLIPIELNLKKRRRAWLHKEIESLKIPSSMDPTQLCNMANLHLATSPRPPNDCAKRPVAHPPLYSRITAHPHAFNVLIKPFLIPCARCSAGDATRGRCCGKKKQMTQIWTGPLMSTGLNPFVKSGREQF